MIRDKLVFTANKRLQEKLLRDNELTLEKAISICRAYEQTTNDMKEMNKSEIKIEKVSNKSQLKRQERMGNQRQNDCRFCGRKHPFEKEKCPAWGKTCSNCGGRNHFCTKCKKVNAVAEENYSDHDYEPDSWLNAVTTGRPHATATLRINDRNVRFQLDTAADVNTICQKHVKKEQARPSGQNLVMWNGTKVTPIGEAILDVFNQKMTKAHKVKFTVVQNSLTCLLGLTTVKELGFISINTDQFIFRMSTQNDAYVTESHPTKEPSDDDKPGELGTAILYTSQDAKPKVLRCRKIPFALTQRVKDELEGSWYQ
ncbi:hypothetical protein RRG08_028453 [Elysia crispata]|uniref:Peptidase A2 domain-containing protein n=1 Tax=Elysia crispata TaxID=231223 RepID=A0AAE1AU22_9GAST|nr:hypothetical protein RRG08_028453 [Elysia crispata]